MFAGKMEDPQSGHVALPDRFFCTCFWHCSTDTNRWLHRVPQPPVHTTGLYRKKPLIVPSARSVRPLPCVQGAPSWSNVHLYPFSSSKKARKRLPPMCVSKPRLTRSSLCRTSGSGSSSSHHLDVKITCAIALCCGVRAVLDIHSRTWARRAAMEENSAPPPSTPSNVFVLEPDEDELRKAFLSDELKSVGLGLWLSRGHSWSMLSVLEDDGTTSGNVPISPE